MTDNEIIKVLECCGKPVSENCKECPLCSQDCLDIDPCELALDLINRQQETIKTLRNCVEQHHIIRKDGKSPLSLLTEEIKSEAIKEFAERLKEKGIKVQGGSGFKGVTTMTTNIQIDNLVKEMEGEKIVL